MENLPVKLKKDSIVDAIIEVRFNNTLNPNVVFALIYEKVREKFSGQVESLPISQMPPAMILQDPNLKFKPMYRIVGDSCSLQIGAQMLAINSKIPYIGWKDFYDMFSWVADQCFDIFGNMVRIGLRYINFFEDNIESKVNIYFSLKDDLLRKRLNIQTEVVYGGFQNLIQFSTNAVTFKNGKETNGSIIDIDTFKVYNGTKYEMVALLSDIENAHKSEKHLFFDLLSKELLDEMEPQYE